VAEGLNQTVAVGVDAVLKAKRLDGGWGDSASTAQAVLVLKKDGVLFVNVAHVRGECGLLRYLLNYLYWRFVRKAPVRFGDYIYWLELEHYRGWHYHSLVISRRMLERLLGEHYSLVDRRVFVKGYFAYILRRK